MIDKQSKRDLLVQTMTAHVEDILKTIQVYLVQLGLTRNPAERRSLAQEMLSETALTVLAPHKVSAFDPDKGTALAWIKRIAFHKVRGLRRDQARRHVRRQDPRRASETPVLDTPETSRLHRRLDDHALSQDAAFAALATRSSGDSEVDTTALASRVLEAASERDRALLQAFYLEERSAAEIGKQVGLSVSAVNTGLSRARARLRNKLSWNNLLKEP